MTRPRLALRSGLCALGLVTALAAPASAANPSLLDQCRVEIGWSRMTPAQQTSPETQFRLELCIRRKKAGH
jgi:hypothetical protein